MKLNVKQIINRNNRIKDKHKAEPRLSKTQLRYLKEVMARRPTPQYVLDIIETLNKDCPCKVTLAGSFKWGYWVDENSSNFEKFIRTLYRGKTKLSDIDVEFVTEPCPQMYERVKSLTDFNIEIVTNPHSHALL